MSDELEPCPGGCNPKFLIIYNRKLDVMAGCDYCGMQVRRRTAESAVEAWNTRPVEDALRAELEQAQEREARLRAALEDLVSALEDGDSIFRQWAKAKAALERTP